MNSIQFSSTVYGDKFGQSVLAITLIDNTGSETNETDVLFNTANPFNSFRGTAYSNYVTGYLICTASRSMSSGMSSGLIIPTNTVKRSMRS